MATFEELGLPPESARAHSRLSAADLAVGLIAEEYRSLEAAPASVNGAGAVQDFFGGPPPRPTVAQRLAQTATAASERGKRYLRRVSRRSTYADVIGRQNDEKKREIGGAVWGLISSRETLQKDFHNNKLPASQDLLGEAGIKVDSLRAETVPRVYTERAKPYDPNVLPTSKGDVEKPLPPVPPEPPKDLYFRPGGGVGRARDSRFLPGNNPPTQRAHQEQFVGASFKITPEILQGLKEGVSDAEMAAMAKAAINAQNGRSPYGARTPDTPSNPVAPYLKQHPQSQQNTDNSNSSASKPPVTPATRRAPRSR